MIRIVDHKKIELSNDEFAAYESLCRSYDRPNFKGEELFKDHFEVNNHGVIIFVRPPHKRYSSLEVYCFLISIMVNQHLRVVHEQTQTLVTEAREKINELVAEKKESTTKN